MQMGKVHFHYWLVNRLGSIGRSCIKSCRLYVLLEHGCNSKVGQWCVAAGCGGEACTLVHPSPCSSIMFTLLVTCSTIPTCSGSGHELNEYPVEPFLFYDNLIQRSSTSVLRLARVPCFEVQVEKWLFRAMLPFFERHSFTMDIVKKYCWHIVSFMKQVFH